jgi:ankyrin repeat protein
MLEIQVAARTGKLAEVKRLVGQDPSLVNAKNRHIGTTPWMDASMGGHVEVVNWFLDQGAAINERADNGATGGSYAS